MGDFADATKLINFKIDPVVIPSTAITKLELFPHASGGISDVWKCAISSELGTSKVAVKSIRTLKDEQESLRMSSRIRREAHLWITLKHDYILHFEGITDGFGKLPAIVSRWMENGALGDYLKREFSTLSDDRKLELVRQVADGLGYLHGKNVVHGDLTDTNVLVDEFGNVRISDFGLSMIAAEAGSEAYSSVQGGNNVRWMAPEFLVYSDESDELRNPTKSGDIYSFGCVMLQILSGVAPYAQLRITAHVIMAIFGEREPFHGVAINMDDDCERLSSQCLSREPEERPTIASVISVIGPVNAHKSVANVSSAQPELDVVSLQDLTEFVFKIEQYPVAGGGFGDIWKCIYKTGEDQISVAVKSFRVYASDTSGEAMEKKSRSIRREINVCAGIKHQNILPLLGYTMDFGPFMAIVTPWAENGSLTAYLTTRGDACLSLTRQFEILRDVADGLQYLHARNVIHGDLTGSNVLIHSNGTACLSDFGLSLRYSDSVSISQADWTTNFHGCFPWLAPELLKQPDDCILVRPSKSSDIYAFGGIMLQVFTSKIPYYYLRNQNFIIASVTAGETPDRSRYPPFSDKYWDIIGECWSAAETRPSAGKIFKVIGDELKLLSSSNTDSKYKKRRGRGWPWSWWPGQGS